MTAIKICGLSTPDMVQHCVDLGVEYVGFVCYPPSARHLSPEHYGRIAVRQSNTKSVLVTVNESDTVLDDYIAAHTPDYVQCHGQETAEEMQRLREKYNVGIIKAIAIATESDLPLIETYSHTADILLLDAKPAIGQMPGGNAKSFDWNLLNQVTFTTPWMLSGGLKFENLENALKTCTPPMVDISSGVERTRGVKDKALITQFIEQVRKHATAA